MTFSWPVFKNFWTLSKLKTAQKFILFSDCGHRKLDFYDTYSNEKCLMECAHKRVMKKCGCRPPYFPNHQNYKYPVMAPKCKMLLKISWTPMFGGGLCKDQRAMKRFFGKMYRWTDCSLNFFLNIIHFIRLPWIKYGD